MTQKFRIKICPKHLQIRLKRTFVDCIEMPKNSIFPSKVAQVVENERLTEVGFCPVEQIQLKRQIWKMSSEFFLTYIQMQLDMKYLIAI